MLAKECQAELTSWQNIDDRKKNSIFQVLNKNIIPICIYRETIYNIKHIISNCISKVKSQSEVTQSCPTLCHPMDCSLPGFSVHGIFQARILSGLPFPSPGDLPDPGIEPRSPAMQADALPSEPLGKPQIVYAKIKILHKNL